MNKPRGFFVHRPMGTKCRFISIAMLLFSVGAHAQSPRPEGASSRTPKPGAHRPPPRRHPPPQRPLPEVQPLQIIQAATHSFHLEYEASLQSRTELRVLAPEGAYCYISDATSLTLVAEGSIPLLRELPPGRLYRVWVRYHDGTLWEQWLTPKQAHVASLWFSPLVGEAHSLVGSYPQAVARHAPLGMAEGGFQALKKAIRAEGFANWKLKALQFSARNASFTVEQVGELVELFDFSSDKMKVVEMVRFRVVDRENFPQLYPLFAFDSEREKVKALLQ